MMDDSILIYQAKRGESIYYNASQCTFQILEIASGKLKHEFTSEGYCLKHKSWFCSYINSATAYDDETDAMEQLYGWRVL